MYACVSVCVCVCSCRVLFALPMCCSSYVSCFSAKCFPCKSFFLWPTCVCKRDITWTLIYLHWKKWKGVSKFIFVVFFSSCVYVRLTELILQYYVSYLIIADVSKIRYLWWNVLFSYYLNYMQYICNVKMYVGRAAVSFLSVNALT